MKTKLLQCLSFITLLGLAVSCSKKEVPVTKSTVKTTTDSIPGTPSLATTYASYTIVSANGGNYLEVSGVNTQGTKMQDGTALDLAQASVNSTGDTDRWQKWIISKQSNGYFTIMNVNSGKYADVPSSSTTAGTAIDQYKGLGEDRQYWSITTAGTNTYKIINKVSGLALTQSASTNGTIITQQPYTATTSQQWALNNIKEVAYRDDAVVGFFQRIIGSDAFDGIPLTYGSNAGKVMWTTNDTFYNQVFNNEFSCGLFFTYHNSALIQPASHTWDPVQTNNITSPDGPQIFHDPNTANLLWPGAGIEVGSHVYVHNIEVTAGTLTTVNQYLYDITESDGLTIPAVNQLVIPGMSGQTDITYSIGMVKPGDGFVYAYGTGGFLGANV